MSWPKGWEKLECRTGEFVAPKSSGRHKHAGKGMSDIYKLDRIATIYPTSLSTTQAQMAGRRRYVQKQDGNAGEFMFINISRLHAPVRTTTAAETKAANNIKTRNNNNNSS